MNGVLKEILLYLLNKLITQDVVDRFKGQFLDWVKALVDSQTDATAKDIELAVYDLLVKVLGA
jgi:hypothetical protein